MRKSTSPIRKPKILHKACLHSHTYENSNSLYLIRPKKVFFTSILLVEMIPSWFYRLEQRKGLFAVGRLCVNFLQIILILSSVWQRRGHVELNVNMRRFIVTKVKSAK